MDEFVNSPTTASRDAWLQFTPRQCQQKIKNAHTPQLNQLLILTEVVPFMVMHKNRYFVMHLILYSILDEIMISESKLISLVLCNYSNLLSDSDATSVD